MVGKSRRKEEEEEEEMKEHRRLCIQYKCEGICTKSDGRVKREGGGGARICMGSSWAG